MSLFVGYLAFAQAPPTGAIYDSTDVVVAVDSTQVYTINEVVNSVIRAITMNPDVSIQLPGPFSLDTLDQWWGIWVGVLLPVGLWLFHLFWPSGKRRDLILKSTIMGLFVIVAIIYIKGVSFPVMLNALIAFILKTLSYQNWWKPLGLKSQRLPSYQK